MMKVNMGNNDAETFFVGKTLILSMELIIFVDNCASPIKLILEAF